MVKTLALTWFLIGAFFIQPVVSDTTNLQVDLLFPRNNTVYQPVYPFPIVFGALNFSVASPYQPILKWTLEARGQPGSNIPGAYKGSTSGEIALNTTSNKSLFVTFDKFISDFNQTMRYELNYVWSMGRVDCFVIDATKFSKSPPSRIFFNTSKDEGIIPDIRSPDSCGASGSASGYIGPNLTDSTCPLLSKPKPKPLSCAYPVDTSIADEVAKAMVNASGCGKASWPNSTGIGTQCTRKSSSTNIAVRWSSFAWVLLVLGFSFVSNI